MVAETLFTLAIGIALLRTALTANAASTVYINIEVHSIAFTALYLWIIPAVMLGSFIGVSQTERSTPDLLERLREDMSHFDLELESQIAHLNECTKEMERRKFSGGIYSWQPARSQACSQRQTSQLIQTEERNIAQHHQELPASNHHEEMRPFVIAHKNSLQVDGRSWR